jgi:hypothetical protein
MNSHPPEPGGSEPPRPPSDPSGSITQEIQHSQASARVPEKVARGVFSTGAVVFQGPHEFIIDFLLRMSRPHQVAARVILPPSIMPSVLGALRENLNNYQARFGPPPPLPAAPPNTPAPSIDDIYSQLKFPDEMLSGTYANAVMIMHSPSEFVFDFITTCYPRSVVSSRVFLAAPQVPGLLANLTQSFKQYQQKLAAQQQRPPEPPRSS